MSHVHVHVHAHATTCHIPHAQHVHVYLPSAHACVADATQGVWSAFERRGYATFLMEELHDGCADLSGSPSSASKLFYSKLGAPGMPHHNAWQVFR